MAFKAEFVCPAEAGYCDFLLIQFSNGRDIGSSSLRLDGGESTVENVDDETKYVGVVDGSARGLEGQARSVSGGKNRPFL